MAYVCSLYNLQGGDQTKEKREKALCWLLCWGASFYPTPRPPRLQPLQQQGAPPKHRRVPTTQLRKDTSKSHKWQLWQKQVFKKKRERQRERKSISCKCKVIQRWHWIFEVPFSLQVFQCRFISRQANPSRAQTEALNYHIPLSVIHQLSNQQYSIDNRPANHLYNKLDVIFHSCSAATTHARTHSHS